MKNIVTRTTRRISLPGAATLLVSTTLLAQLLGFLRTKLVNANFDIIGPESTDVYFASFKIPDFFFYVLAAGVLSVVLIPILSDRMEKGDKAGVWKLSNSLMNLLALVTLGIALCILLFAEQLMSIVVHDMPPEQFANSVAILRLIAFNPFFFTMSGILTSTQQVFGRFVFFALTPIVYNVSIIASIYMFKDSVGIVGLGIGAMVGGLLQMLFAFSGVIGLGYRWQPKIAFKSTNFRKILHQLPARSLDQGVDSVNSIVETNRATAIGTGVVSSYENAFVLHTAPILLIGSSISTAAFPRLTERLSQGRTDLFRKEFIGVLRVLIWTGLPVMIIAYFCRGYLARIIFSKGSQDIALLVGFLSVAIFFRIIFTLLTRYFYAYKDSTTPLIVSVFAIALNIILVFTLTRESAYGIAGLGMAQSITSVMEVLVLGIVIALRDPLLFKKDLWEDVIKMLSVSGFTIVTAFIMVTLIPLDLNDTGFFVLGAKLGAIMTATVVTHIAVSSIFGFKEAENVINKIKRAILRPVKIS